MMEKNQPEATPNHNEMAADVLFQKKMWPPFGRRILVVALVTLALLLVVEVFVFNFQSFRLLFGPYTQGTWEVGDAVEMEGLTQSSHDPSVFIADTARPSLTFEINQEVGTLYVDVQSNKDDRYILQADILYTDDTHHHYIESAAYLEIVKDTPRTNYKTCEYSGELGKLKLRFYTDVGESLTIRGIRTNRMIPITFSAGRVALLWVLIVGFYIFRKAPSFQRGYSAGNPVHRWAPVAVTGLFLVYMWGIFALYETPFIHVKSFTSESGNQISQELVDAFEAGQVSLLEEPSDELLEMEYPYEWTARDLADVDYLWDHLLYNGKYYSYYGIAPVLVLFLPYHLLTGYYFPTNYACLIFGWLGIVFLAAAYWALMRRRLQKVPFNLAVGGLLLLLMTSGVQFSIYRPYFYELAEMSGFMFFSLGLYFLATSGILGDGRVRLYKLSLSAVAISLAVLSRPTFALYAVAALIWLWFGLKAYRREQPQPSQKRHVVRYLFASLMPYAVFGGIQMAYNYARFGSPLEFGIQYSLTVNNFIETQFHPSLAAVSLYNLLFALPQFQLNFPFIHGTTHQLEVNGYYFFETSSAVGLLWRALPLGGLAYAPRALRPMSWKKRGKLFAVIGIPAVVVPLVLMAMTWESGYALRYSVDFAWQIVLAGLLVCFYVYSRCTSRRMKQFLTTAMLVAAVWCMISTTALVFARVPDDVTVGGIRLQLEYYRLARLLTFWK